jgi:hypothetical protein
MTRRKGARTPQAIDRDWPHQVALKASFVAGANYATVEQAKSDLKGCPRSRHIRGGDVDYIIYCFQTPEAAAAFHQRFGGYSIEPKSGRKPRMWRELKNP